VILVAICRRESHAGEHDQSASDDRSSGSIELFHDRRLVWASQVQKPANVDRDFGELVTRAV